MKKPKRFCPHLLLDSNVWRYISDADAYEELRKDAARYGVRILIAPSVLYEALRLEDRDLRSKLIRLMTNTSWKRLMPEAYDESLELLHEIKRLRKQWCRAQPDLAKTARLKADWCSVRKGFWMRLRNNPDPERCHLQQLEGKMLEDARDQAKRNRHIMQDAGWRYDTINLNEITGNYMNSAPGWNGDNIEPWRVYSLNFFFNLFKSSRVCHPYIDWISGIVDLNKAVSSREEWNRFWLYEVKTENIPRQWLRWAFETLQGSRKVNDGTPCDAQLSTYLTDCDYFVTADKTMTQIIDKCWNSSPFQIAKAILVHGDKIEAVDDLLHLIKCLPNNHN